MSGSFGEQEMPLEHKPTGQCFDSFFECKGKPQCPLLALHAHQQPYYAGIYFSSVKETNKCAALPCIMCQALGEDVGGVVVS